MNKINIQYFDWGQIEWMYEPEYGNSTNVMHIGIITIFPGKRQTKHVHYGDEQFLYVFSGTGEQLIDETVNTLEPGANFHIEAGSVHETINIGDKPIKELLISIPAFYESSSFIQNKAESVIGSGTNYNTPIKIDDKVKSIYDRFLSSLNIPLSVFDNEDNAVIQGQGYPEFCELRCNVRKDLNNCCIYKIRDKYTSPQYSDPSAFICPFGLTVFIVPILFNEKVIGIIKGGHFKTASDNPAFASDVSYNLLPVVPKARLNATLLQVEKLSKNIVNYYIFENTEIELGKREEIIQDISKHEMMLEESLKSSQEKVLSTQINNHFLFNTLNAIAGLAVKENAFKTYESVINLSKMFRYSLKTNSSFVKLKQELDYLLYFIDLQKLRYGDRLGVKLDVPEEIMDIVIPFNCLQPILENCFIHGFKDEKNKMQIQVSGRKEKNSVIIEISDNGSGMTEEQLEALNMKVHQSNGREIISGLVMIFKKLQLYYSESFAFEISSAPNKGTSTRITIYDKLT